MTTVPVQLDVSLAAAAWRARSSELADWAVKRLVNRTDVWGGYLPLAFRKEKARADGGTYLEETVTKPRTADRGKKRLTKAVLQAHFSGRDVGGIAGLHSTGEDGMSRWFMIDVDSHGDDNIDPARNLNAARDWYDKLVSLGFSPLLVDSDGKGGYHLWGV